MDRISNKTMAALQDTIDFAKNAVRKVDTRAFIEYDAEFHEIIAKESGSRRLLELCQFLRRHMLRYRMESIVKKEIVLRSLDEHQRIVDCMRKMDKQGIEAAILEHLEHVKTAIHRYAFGRTDGMR